MTGNTLRFLLVLVVLAALGGLAACYPRPALSPGENATFPLKQGETSSGWKNLTVSPSGILPGDVLELSFNFGVAQVGQYRINIHDMLEVKFPPTMELNEQQRVRPDGMISLPFLGDVKAVNKTPQELTRELRERYEPILNIPDVYVVVSEYGSRMEEIRLSVTSNGQGQSKLVQVRRDGHATFPLLGDTEVAGKTIAELNTDLQAKYKAIDPGVHVDLSMSKAVQARIAVLGAVNTPGFHPVDGPVTLMEALALGGGFRNDASLSSVICIRRDADMVRYVAINAKNMLAGDPTDEFIMLPERSVVFVTRTPISETAELVDQLARSFVFRGWGFTFGDSINAF